MTTPENELTPTDRVVRNTILMMVRCDAMEAKARFDLTKMIRESRRWQWTWIGMAAFWTIWGGINLHNEFIVVVSLINLGAASYFAEVWKQLRRRSEELLAGLPGIHSR